MFRPFLTLVLCVLYGVTNYTCHAQSWTNDFSSNRSRTALSVAIVGSSRTSALTKESFFIAKRILSQAGLPDLKMTSHELISNDAINSLFVGRVPQLSKFHKSADLSIIILPRDIPITSQILEDDEGRAQGIGLLPHHKHPYAIIKTQNDALTTGKIIAHEIGHLLGATHSTQGIMQPHIEQVAMADGFYFGSTQQIRENLARPFQPFVSALPSSAVALTGKESN